MEQRRRYKLAFNAQYDEYRKAHAKLVEVSQRFSRLEQNMTYYARVGNWDEYEVLYRTSEAHCMHLSSMVIGCINGDVFSLFRK